MNKLLTQNQIKAQQKYADINIAERVVQNIRNQLTPVDISFIQQCEFFFLSTSDGDEDIQCSFKGGEHFIHVASPEKLVYPEYIGNHLMQSVGNMLSSPNVGMLFIDFQHQKRLRVNGKATLYETSQHELSHIWPDAKLIIEIELTQILTNCSRNIPKLTKSG